MNEVNDLSELVTTLATKGIVVQYEEHTTNNRSPIRNYDRFVT